MAQLCWAAHLPECLGYGVKDSYLEAHCPVQAATMVDWWAAGGPGGGNPTLRALDGSWLVRSHREDEVIRQLNCAASSYREYHPENPVFSRCVVPVEADYGDGAVASRS
jgi:hypothetical protein